MRLGQQGGNRKRQTYADCQYCGNRFGPLDRLSQRFCSSLCNYEDRKTKPSGKLGKRYHFWKKLRWCQTCHKPFSPRGEFKIRIQKYCCLKCWTFRKGGNRSSWRDALKATLTYRQWRTSVFLRDGYICKWCGDSKGGNLEAHHIKPVSIFPESACDINNGITLCKSCHETTYKAKPRCDVVKLTSSN